MMDAGVVGLGAGVDTASSSRAAAKSSGGEGGNAGFSDVLSSQEGGKQQASKPGQESGNLDEQGADTARRKMKRDPWQHEHALDGREPHQAAANGKAASEEIQRKLEQREEDKEALAELLSAKPGKGKAAKTDGASVAGKSDEGNAGEEAADIAAKTAAGKGEGNVSDVLSLLDGNAVAAIAGQQGERRTDGRRDPATIRADGADSRDQLGKKSDGDRQLPGDDAARELAADSSKTFRFSRSDGRGQAMDMTISGGRGERAEATARSAGTGQAETVTVLEARRYLGFEAAANSASVVSSLSSDPEWKAALQPGSALSNAAAWTSTGKVVNTLKIQMNPIELGLVTATMRLRGEELTVELTVETRAAYQQLADDQRKIVEALRAQGFAVDQVTISLASAERADTSGQNGSQGQAFGQQASQGGEGNGSSGGRAGDANAERGRNGEMAADDKVAEHQADAGTGGARPGHVYI